MLIELDQKSPNELQDSILYYIGGNIAQSLLKALQCSTCKSAVLLDPENPHGEDMSSYPPEAKFTSFKQKGGLLFPSLAVFKIIQDSRCYIQEKGALGRKRNELQEKPKKENRKCCSETTGFGLICYIPGSLL